MCGVNGIFSKNKILNIEKRIISMNNSIIHRGPDAGSYFIDKNIAIGHRRLSIIDTHSRSNQPMHTSSNIWHIVFNGEIYNFKAIRKDLRYPFSTNSDTEVIIAAVEEKGLNWFLERANGMFAIALFNSQTDQLFLIRDRLGIKPLYYFHDSNQFIFSSEIKGILSSGLVPAIFNEKAVDEYLANRFVRAPYTFFENIKQVNPGEYIVIDNNLNLKEKVYWQLPSEFNVSSNFNETSITKKFEDELLKAIKLRLISDVPLGTYLSGGVDSSLITAIVSKNKADSINTYTIGFQESNEFEFARAVSEKYHTTHHEIMMRENEYINHWERLIALKDSPLGVPNEIPLAIMSEKLKEDITVVLSGEGADELMGGYGKIYRLPFDYSNNHSESSFYDSFIDKYEYVPRKIRDKFINTSKLYREEFDEKIRNDFTHYSNEQNVFRYFHMYHVKGLLQRVDMTTMQTSVEARVPFLDHNLIEFCYSKIPYKLKLKWKSANAKNNAKNLTSGIYSETLDTPKYLLRKIAYQYLPPNIVDRKKVGFPVPLSDWMKNLEGIALELLSDAKWLKNEAVKELIIQSKNENRSAQILWMFINIELFKKQYFNKKWIW